MKLFSSARKMRADRHVYRADSVCLFNCFLFDATFTNLRLQVHNTIAFAYHNMPVPCLYLYMNKDLCFISVSKL